MLLDEVERIAACLFPGAAGCASRVQASPGETPKVMLLIENDRFWESEAFADSISRIHAATGLEELEVHLVPRHFLVRSASGQIHREETLEAWRAHQRSLSDRNQSASIDIAQELLIQFPGIPEDRQIRKELNSVGNLVLKLFCVEHGILYGPGLTLARMVKAAEVAQKTRGEVFSIIALMDGSRLGFGSLRPFIDEAFLNSLSLVVGCPVHLEQICVPPAPVLLSDLIFHDYFLPRRPDPAYRAVSSLIRKIKQASLILVDDEDNFRTTLFCSYPLLDHQFVNHPDADLLGHRTQRYTQNHHKLPRQVVLGRDVKRESINPALESLENYLKIPILKMAFHAQFRPYTEHWDFCDYRPFVSDAEKSSNPAWIESFRVFLIEFIERRAGKFQKSDGELINRFTLLDNVHFCSYLLNRDAVDFVTSQYDSFCIIGLPSSLPYLTQRLQQMGKPHCFCSQLTSAHADYACIVITGGTVTLPESRPTFDFMHARKEGEGGGRPHNVSPALDGLCPPLMACSESIYRQLRERIDLGQINIAVSIGNWILNNTTEAPESVL